MAGLGIFDIILFFVDTFDPKFPKYNNFYEIHNHKWTNQMD